MLFNELTEFISLDATIPTIDYLYRMGLDQNKKIVETMHLILHEDCQSLEDLYNKYNRYKKYLIADTADIIEKLYAITKRFDDDSIENDICILNGFNIYIRYNSLDIEKIHLRELNESNFTDIMCFQSRYGDSQLQVNVKQNNTMYVLRIPILYYIDPTLLNTEEFIQSNFRLIKPNLRKSPPPELK